MEDWCFAGIHEAARGGIVVPETLASMGSQIARIQVNQHGAFVQHILRASVYKKKGKRNRGRFSNPHGGEVMTAERIFLWMGHDCFQSD